MFLYLKKLFFMKKHIILFSFVCLVLISSCKKDGSILSNAIMTAKIDGTKWVSITRVTIQKSGIFLITGTSTEGQAIEVTINGSTTGTYTLEASTSSASAQCGAIYKPTINNSDSTYVSKSGQVAISKIDTENQLISGTFNFVVTNLDVTKNITEGKFSDLKYQIQ